MVLGSSAIFSAWMSAALPLLDASGSLPWLMALLHIWPILVHFSKGFIQLFVCARPTLARRIGLDLKPPIEPEFATFRLVVPEC